MGLGLGGYPSSGPAQSPALGHRDSEAGEGGPRASDRSHSKENGGFCMEH